MWGITYGNFMRIKIQVVKNETRMEMNPIEMRNILLAFDVVGLCVLSRMTNPMEPRTKRNEAARPSIMY